MYMSNTCTSPQGHCKASTILLQVTLIIDQTIDTIVTSYYQYLVLPTLPLSKPVSDRRSRDAAAGYGGNDQVVRAHTAPGAEQRGVPPPAQCMFKPPITPAMERTNR